MFSNCIQVSTLHMSILWPIPDTFSSCLPDCSFTTLCCTYTCTPSLTPFSLPLCPCSLSFGYLSPSLSQHLPLTSISLSSLCLHFLLPILVFSFCFLLTTICRFSFPSLPRSLLRYHLHSQPFYQPPHHQVSHRRMDTVCRGGEGEE